MTEIRVPELGLDDVPVSVSVWHVPLGRRVERGESVVELVAGDIAVDVAAPSAGVLVAKCVGEETNVAAGTVLGRIEVAPGGSFASR